MTLTPAPEKRFSEGEGQAGDGSGTYPFNNVPSKLELIERLQ